MIKIEIKKVDNGYIVKKYGYGDETNVYRDFLEIINWIAWIFNERISHEEVVECLAKLNKT